MSLFSPSFEKAVSRVLSHEGGYVNNPLDPGKETIWGITARIARRNHYDGDMRFMPREFAIDIYHQEYWLPIRGEDLPFPLSFLLFDAAVNSGPPQSIKWLQKICKINDDGIFGPITFSSAQKLDPFDYPLLIAQRGEFQASLPTWPAFGKGWARRLYTNLRYLSEDLKSLPPL